MWHLLHCNWKDANGADKFQTNGGLNMKLGERNYYGASILIDALGLQPCIIWS